MFDGELLSAHKNIVLIGYSNYFNENSFFIKKTEHVLDGLNDFIIIAIDDTNRLIENNYPLHVLDVVSSKDITDKEVSSIFEKVTHSIIFWDGEDLNKFVFAALRSQKPYKIIPVKTTKVANKDRDEEYDVYIGRKGPWGNPYHIGKDGERDEVIKKYRKYFYETILNNLEKKEALHKLKGLRLGCHCKPFACHGDVIAEYLNKLEVDDNFD